MLTKIGPIGKVNFFENYLLYVLFITIIELLLKFIVLMTFKYFYSGRELQNVYNNKM